jgi:phage-related protein
MYKVLYYATVDEYLSELAKKSMKDKAARVALKSILYHIELLKIKGTQLPMPYARHIVDSIWELRPSDRRIFYAFYENDTFILLHYYHKKTQKAPKQEIDKTKRILREVLETKDEEN